jgi:hypothetical protein
MIALAIFMAASCSKPVPDGFRVDNPQQYSLIYLGKAFHGNMNITLLPERDTVVNVYANYSGLLDLDAPVAVTFEAKQELVAEYNELMRTSYIPLPQTNYILEHRTVSIKAGESSSEAMKLRISSDELPGKGPYMLAVSITQVNGAATTVNPDLNTLYLIMNYDDSSLSYPNYEKAGWNVLDASSYEQDALPESVLDGDRNTFWTCSDEEEAHSLVIDMRRPHLIHGFNFTSRIRLLNGEEYHYAGQPRNVMVSVSADNESWTEVVADAIVPFGIESSLTLDNYVKARYVKLEVSKTWITKNSAGTFLSFSEFNVF